MPFFYSKTGFFCCHTFYAYSSILRFDLIIPLFFCLIFFSSFCYSIPFKFVVGFVIEIGLVVDSLSWPFEFFLDWWLVMCFVFPYWIGLTLWIDLLDLLLNLFDCTNYCLLGYYSGYRLNIKISTMILNLIVSCVWEEVLRIFCICFV